MTWERWQKWPDGNSPPTANKLDTCRKLEAFLVEASGDVPAERYADAFCRHLAGLEAEDDFPIEALSPWLDLLRRNFGASDFTGIDQEQIRRVVERWTDVERSRFIAELTPISDLAREGFGRLHAYDARIIE